MEARRAKTWRAFGQGLVHDSRPPKGARTVGGNQGVDLGGILVGCGGNLYPLFGPVRIITTFGNKHLAIF